MFPNDIDKDKYPLPTRRWGMFIGTLMMVAAVPLCLVSPGTLEITLPFVLAACLFAAWRRGYLAKVLVPTFTHGTKIAAALLGFAAVSAFWSDRPFESLGWVTGSTIAALTCGMAVRYFMLEPRSSALHIAEGLWIGFLAGLLYLGVEALTGQAIKIFVYNLVGLRPSHLKPHEHFTWVDGRLVAIADFDLTRSFTCVPVMLWGVLLAILGSQQPQTAKRLAWGTFVFACAVVFAGSNETAKLAMVAGGAAFAIAWYNNTACSRVLQIVWVVVCLAIVPITLGLYRANLHNASWVQPTAQHRIIIWNRFTEETMKRPLLGVGAGMTYWNYAPKKVVKGESYTRYSRDVHCVYLQVWFELGVFGAILLSLLGLAIINRVQSLPAQAVPYGYAAFASAATTLASSYGLWRPWFNLTFAIAVVCFAIGLRAIMRREVIIPTHNVLPASS